MVERIPEIYGTLPENSKGGQADNPDLAQNFFDPRKINSDAWPFLILCRDCIDGGYTWHMGCDEYLLERWKDIGRIFLELYVSRIRGRILVFEEILDRNENHFFIE